MSFTRRTFLGSSAATAAGVATATQSSFANAEDKTAEEKVDVSKLGKTQHTKFAVNLEMWWRKVPKFEDRIRKAAEFGFPAFEMWPYQGKDIDGIARLTKELGIEISQFTAWPAK